MDVMSFLWQLGLGVMTGTVIMMFCAGLASLEIMAKLDSSFKFSTAASDTFHGGIKQRYSSMLKYIAIMLE